MSKQEASRSTPRCTQKPHHPSFYLSQRFTYRQDGGTQRQRAGDLSGRSRPPRRGQSPSPRPPVQKPNQDATGALQRHVECETLMLGCKSCCGPWEGGDRTASRSSVAPRTNQRAGLLRQHPAHVRQSKGQGGCGRTMSLKRPACSAIRAMNRCSLTCARLAGWDATAVVIAGLCWSAKDGVLKEGEMG